MSFTPDTIRNMALARGLSPHQADVAVEVFGLFDAAGRCRWALLTQLSGQVPPMCSSARAETIVSKAMDAVREALSLQLHNLGLSLAPKVGKLHIDDWIGRQVRLMSLPADMMRAENDRQEVAGAAIEMARTAPARKPGKRPYTTRRPAAAAPYWAGLDGNLLWAPGVVM